MNDRRRAGHRDKTVASKYDFTKVIEALKAGRALTRDELFNLIIPKPSYRSEAMIMNIDLPIYEITENVYKLLTKEDMDIWQSTN